MTFAASPANMGIVQAVHAFVQTLERLLTDPSPRVFKAIPAMAMRIMAVSVALLVT